MYIHRYKHTHASKPCPVLMETMIPATSKYSGLKKRSSRTLTLWRPSKVVKRLGFRVRFCSRVPFKGTIGFYS